MMSLKFDDYLKQTWKELFDSQDGQMLFRSGFKFLHLRPLEGSDYIAYFNTAYNENKRETQIDFEGVEAIKPADKTEEVAKSDKIVLQDFDETKFNYNQVEPEEVLFHIDLENEEIVTKEALSKKNEDEMLEGKELEGEISQSETHPLLANVSPVCPNHCILPLFPQEELPQVIGSDIIVLLLQLFKLSQAEDLKVGFNSTGACAHVNHLHFHLLYASELFKSGKLPIENAKTKQVLKSSLKNPSDSIQMYNVGVIVEELENHPVDGIVVTPADPKADPADILSSLSFAAGAITNLLIESDTPHNIIITDKGYKIIIIPRKFEKEYADFHMHASWLEIAGLAIIRSKEAFQTVTAETYSKVLRTEVSLDKKDFDAFKTKLTEFFKAHYE